MKWKKGDKVKFLNEAGGGYITEIVSPSVVKVSNEDGFEIPYAVADLLQLQTQHDDDPAAKFFDEEYSSPLELIEKNAAEAVENTAVSSALFKRKSMHIDEGIYLAFVPQDQRLLTSGLMDIYILNHSPNDILFSFLQKTDDENEVVNKDYDVIGPHNKYLLETIEREEISQYTEAYLQALIVPPAGHSKVIAPMNKHYKVKAAKLYQENNYKFVDVLNENAFVVEMAKMDYLNMISRNMLQKDQPTEAAERSRNKVAERSLIAYHKTATLEAEVDLHISALMDDFGYMKPHEILQKQMDYFNRCIEDAMRQQYRKLVFIHGIGNGTLKKRLKDELRGYEEIEVRDAAFQQYGYGAIEIQIHYQ